MRIQTIRIDTFNTARLACGPEEHEYEYNVEELVALISTLNAQLSKMKKINAALAPQHLDTPPL